MRWTLARYVDRNRFSLGFLCLEARGEIGAEIAAMGFPVEALGVTQRFWSPRTYRALSEFLWRAKYDIVQSALSNTNLYTRAAALRRGVPIIIAEEHSHYERYNTGLGFLFRRLHRHQLARTSALIACSEATARALCDSECLPREKVHVVYNGVDPDVFRPRVGPRVEGPVRLIYTASLGARKDHHTLLRALTWLRRRGLEIRAWLVGDGPERSALVRAAQELGIHDAVEFTGERRDIPALLRQSDVFVATPRDEAFGLNILEAMASGLPVVATRTGGIPEVVQEMVTGLLVNVGDDQGVAAGILKLVEDSALAERLGQAGRRRAVERFSGKVYVERLQALWDDLWRRHQGEAYPPRSPRILDRKRVHTGVV